MKLLPFLLLLLLSCTDKTPTRNLDFIVEEKMMLPDQNRKPEYFLKSKDTLITVDNYDYAKYKPGDTIFFEIPIKGFFKGTLFIRDVKYKTCSMDTEELDKDKKRIFNK